MRSDVSGRGRIYRRRDGIEDGSGRRRLGSAINNESFGGGDTVPQSFLALDTTEGVLCRTWDFSWTSPTAIQKSMQELPICESLYDYDKLHEKK